MQEPKRSTSFWQSPLWSDILTESNHAEAIVYHYQGNEIYIERRTIWRRYTGLYIIGIDPTCVNRSLIAEIRQKIAQPSDLFLQIEPYNLKEDAQEHPVRKKNPFSFIFDIMSFVASAKNDGYLIFVDHAPFRRFLEPTTAVLDLCEQSEESLLKHFSEKGRYNIRLAQKRGIVTRWVSAQDVGAIDDFYALLEKTTARDKFHGNSRKYYQTFLNVLEQYNAGGLLVAEKDGYMHAGGIFVYFNNQAIYYYGASSDNPSIRRDMATYLVQWEAIREALARGCTTYDFLGISKNGKGKLNGVTEFKRKFNPEIIDLPRETVVKYHPILLIGMQCMRYFRKIARSLPSLTYHLM